MRTPSRIHITALIALLWAFGMIAIYYVSHKPFTPDIALNLVLAAWRIAAAVLLLALAGGIGGRLYRGDHLHPAALAVVQMALGIGLLALLYLLIGMTLGLPAWLPWVLLALLVVVFRRPVLAWLGLWRSMRTIWSETTGFSRVMAGMVGLLLFAALTFGLAPPIKYDALVYHLVLPEAYLQAGRITYLPWLMKVGMPQTVEMLFAWETGLGGGAGAAVLGWVSGTATIAGLLGYLYQKVGARPAWVGIAALLGGFTLPLAVAWAYVDWWCLMFGFGALVCLDGWRQGGGRRELAAAGLMAGFALGTKYPAGVLGIAAGVTLLWNIWKRRERLLPRLVEFGMPALLAPLPWLVKNLVMTGNPVYPLFFESGAMTAVRHEVYQVMPPFGDWQDLFLLPFRATYMGHDTAMGYSVAIGPLLLAFGVLAWIGWRRLPGGQQVSLENATVFAVSGLVVWALGNQLSGLLIQTRFYFAIFPAFVLLAAYGYRALSSLSLPQVRLERILSVLIGLVLALNLIEVGTFVLQARSPQAALGIEPANAYIAHNLGWYQPVMQALLELPEEARVIMMFEPRAYYCLPRCDPDETLDVWRQDWQMHGSAEAVLNAWRDAGYTHFLYHRAGMEILRESGELHYSEDEWQALDAFAAGLNEVQNFGDVYFLYDIRSSE